MSAALLIIALLAGSGETSSPPRFEGEIVVTAERGAEERDAVTSATSVLTREEIESFPADDLADVIGHLPGLTVLLEGAGNRPIVSARGFFGGGEAEYVQLVVDGVPAGDAESGLVDWKSLPAEAIERVEYARGPASALYGDTAMAGVIEVFTRAAVSKSAGTAGVELGNDDTRRGTLFWRRRGSVDGGLAASVTKTDGFREHSAAESIDGEAFAAFHRGRSTIAMRISGAFTDRQEPGMLPLDLLTDAPRASLDLFRFDEEESDRIQASVTVSRNAGVPLQIAAWAKDRQTDLRRTVLLAAGLGDLVERQIDTRSFGGSAIATWAGHIAARANELRTGFDVEGESIDTAYFEVDAAGDTGERLVSVHGSRLRLALFASDHFDLTPRVRITAGVRYDAIADEFTTTTRHESWSPRGGINVRLGADGTRPYVLFAQLSRAFKAPTLDQLFDARPFPDFMGGTFTVSNATLEPQHATNLEVGLWRSTPALRWELVAYRMDVTDEIDFDIATFRYLNIGQTRHYGVESSASWRLPVVAPRVRYEWTRAESALGVHRGRQLKNIPEHVFQAGARADLPAELELDVSLRLLSGWFLDDANAVAMDDSWRLDFRLRREFGRWSAHLDAENVFDRSEAQVGVLLPDFQGGEVPYAYPSAGRTVQFGIRRHF